MSFDSALSHHDSDATTASRAATASGGADSIPTMAKKNQKSVDTSATEQPVSVNPNTASVHDAAVRKAERAFLAAVEQGGDGAAERAALVQAKADRKAFMVDRLPIACRAFLALPTDATDAAKLEAMKELRSALSALATPTPVNPTPNPTDTATS